MKELWMVLITPHSNFTIPPVIITRNFDYQHIDQLMVREKGKIGRGAWQGALIGASLGALIGWLTYDKEENNWYFGTHGKQIYLTAILGGITFSTVAIAVNSYRMKVDLVRSGTSQVDLTKMHYFSRFDD